MSKVNDSVEFRCSKCGYTRQIPRSKLASGKGRYRITCPRCGEKTVLDLAVELHPTPLSASTPPSVPQLQKQIDETPPQGRLNIPPGEFLGQVIIDHPIILEGLGKKTWIGAATPPVVKITSTGVVLRNLMVEATGKPDSAAIEAVPGSAPIFENVVVRGSTTGVSSENFRNTEDTKEASPIKVTFTPPPPISGDPTAATLGISPLETESGFPSRVDQKIQSLFDDADQAEQKQDWNGAVEAYKDILQLSPDNSDAKKLLERARMKLPQAVASAAPQKPPSAAKAPPTPTPSCTELIAAARRGSVQEIEGLLNLSCRVNGTDSDGWTALMFAAGGGHIHVVRAMLQHGAEVNPQNKHRDSALHLAALNDRSETVSILVQHGANVNKLSLSGRTALMYAAERGYSNTVRVLVGHGVDVKQRNSRGESALDLAILAKAESTIDLLVKAGAQASRSTIPTPPPGPTSQQPTAPQQEQKKGDSGGCGCLCFVILCLVFGLVKACSGN